MVAFSRSNNPIHQLYPEQRGAQKLTYIGNFLAYRDFNVWAFLLNNRSHDFFMLGGEIDRRVDCRYSYCLDPLSLDFGTYAPNLIGVDLKSVFDSYKS